MVLLGAPGSGKGTQAEILAERIGVPSISTGEMLREAVAAGAPLGEKVKAILASGELVDDETISTIPLLSETTARIAYNWNTSAVSLTAGQHDLTIRVSDTAGNQATATVRVNVRK